MNAQISQIESCDGLNLVGFEFDSQTLFMLSLELNDDIKIGSKVELSVKPSSIAIANECFLTSHSNVFECKIFSMDIGKILCFLKLSLSDGSILEAIISSQSAKKLDLFEQKKVFAYVKASELSIKRLIS